MKQEKKLKATSYIVKQLLAKFADGKPLAVDELHFLDWHQKVLSDPHLDPAINYYLKHYHHSYSEDHSFLLPNEIMNKDAIEKLKKRLKILLAQKSKYVFLKMPVKEFDKFKSLAYQELILTHGNQLLTGAPFHPGGIPYTIYFQWGNLFGVAKYVVLPEEKALKGNVLVYFEDMSERLLEQCVKDFEKKYQFTPSFELKAAPIQENMPLQDKSASYKTPSLTLSLNTEKKDDKKS